jgi:hypothetical protein
MKRSKIVRYGVWLVPPVIGAAAMLAFLLVRDSGGETFTPPAAVGEQDLPGTPVAPEKIQEARDFKGWPLWWLGESFDSLNLAYVLPFTNGDGSSEVDRIGFIYGTCTQPTGSEGGCAPPLSLQIEPLCKTLPEMIMGFERSDLFDFRGAKALWVDERQLGVWTGDSAVFVFGSRDRILRAADVIVPLGNVQVALTGSNLPPPNFESCPETPIYPTPFPYPPTKTP